MPIANVILPVTDAECRMAARSVIQWLQEHYDGMSSIDVRDKQEPYDEVVGDGAVRGWWRPTGERDQSVMVCVAPEDATETALDKLERLVRIIVRKCFQEYGDRDRPQQSIYVGLEDATAVLFVKPKNRRDIRFLRDGEKRRRPHQ